MKELARINVCRFQLYIQSSKEGMKTRRERIKQGQGQGGKVETLGILPNSSITPTDCVLFTLLLEYV